MLIGSRALIASLAFLALAVTARGDGIVTTGTSASAIVNACAATNGQILYDNAGNCAGETLVPAANGGTGVANSSTITLGGAVSTAGALTTSGAFGLTLTATATTNSTLPAGTHTLGGLDVAQTWSAIQTFTSGMALTVRTVVAAGAITVATSDIVVCVNKTSGAATTANLFATPATGSLIIIKDCKGDAATNNITVTPAAGNIDGSATFVINTNYGVWRGVYTGAAWSTM